MRKKEILLVLICIFLGTYAFAGFYQKTYIAKDDVVIRTEKLSRLNGQNGFAPVYPITAEKLKECLDKIDYDTLSDSLKAEYDYIIDELGIEDSVLDFSLYSNIDTYAFNHRQDTPYTEYFVPYYEQMPLLAFEMESGFSNVLYLDMVYFFKNSPKGFKIGDDGIVAKGNYFYDITNAGFLFSPTINGEWEYLSNPLSGQRDDTHNLLTYQPFKLGAYLSNGILGFYMGRTRQSMGSGVTGNLIIGDNFSFQEIMRFSAHSDIFNYYLSLTHYDNVEEAQDFRFDGIHQNRTIQRFDFNFKDKVRFAVDLGCHIASSSMFDWRMFTPMSFVHNWNNNSEDINIIPGDGDEINNILGVELEIVPIKGLKLTAQFALDQFRLKNEIWSTLPNAFGILFNAKYVFDVGRGFLDNWIEAVYLNPYLYLNHKNYNDDVDKPYMYLDHMGGYWYEQSGVGEYNYFGHSFGPGTIAVSVGTDYVSDFCFAMKGSITYIAQGYRGRLYNLDSFLSGTDYWGWSEIMEVPSEKVESEWGTLHHSLSFQISSSYSIINNLDIYAAMNMSYYWNYHNVPNAERFTIQSRIGLSYKFF